MIVTYLLFPSPWALVSEGEDGIVSKPVLFVTSQVEEPVVAICEINNSNIYQLRN